MLITQVGSKPDYFRLVCWMSTCLSLISATSLKSRNQRSLLAPLTTCYSCTFLHVAIYSIWGLAVFLYLAASRNFAPVSLSLFLSLFLSPRNSVHSLSSPLPFSICGLYYFINNVCALPLHRAYSERMISASCCRRQVCEILRRLSFCSIVTCQNNIFKSRRVSSASRPICGVFA